MQSTRLTSVANDMTELIGQTPMVWLKHDYPNIHGRIALKLESENPLGSVKDRLALSIIDRAEKAGKIKPGVSTLIEATSGNTGIGLALIGSLRGYRVLIIMSETVSMERRSVLRALGAELLLYSKNRNIAYGNEYAEYIAKEIPNAFLCSQFENEANPEVHFSTTGPEIWSQCNGKVDYFIAGIGTGGTLAGTAKYLKSVNPNVCNIALEPKENPVFSAGGPIGSHGIQGIGASFVPGVLQRNRQYVDETILVDTNEALAMARKLPTMSGVFCGISGGATVAAALRVAARPEAAGKVIVAIIASYGERYLSTVLFDDIRKECDAMKPIPDEIPRKSKL